MYSSPQSQTRTAVIVPTFNRAGYIDECLRSLLAQTRPPDEIFVVDDGSTDDTAERVAAYRDRVRYVFTPNGGKSCALNLALDSVVADRYWLFDDDDVALPDALARLGEALDCDPGADFAYSGQIIGVRDAQGALQHGSTAIPYAGTPRQVFHQALTQFPFRLQGALIGRQCFDMAGRFDPRFLRSQDYEFTLRLLQHCRGVRLEGPTFVWRVHEGPRGPRIGLHAGAQRVKVWMQFDGLIGRELRQRLLLDDFVPDEGATRPPTGGARRLALLNRMAVMASKGLVEEMVADLRDASETSQDPPEQITAVERAVLRGSATYEYFLMRLLEHPQRVTGQIAQAGTGGFASAAKQQFARGLLWSARNADVRLRDRWTLARAAVSLFARRR